jgi:hypothetical protein
MGTANNMVYPVQGAGPGSHPHAPDFVCGRGVYYDANGNTTSYDPDGAAGPIQQRSFVYNNENRPTSITSQGATTSFDYGPDGERFE